MNIDQERKYDAVNGKIVNRMEKKTVPDLALPLGGGARSPFESSDSAALAGYVLVERHPKKLEVSTLCRLMDDCLHEDIEDEQGMQKLIDRLWPALICEFEKEI